MPACLLPPARALLPFVLGRGRIGFRLFFDEFFTRTTVLVKFDLSCGELLVLRKTRLGTLVPFLLATGAVSANAGGSITDEAFGTYSVDQCGSLSERTLVIEPGAISFYEAYCEILEEDFVGGEASLALSCNSEGYEYQMAAKISVYMNGNLWVETSEGIEDVYEFCSDGF